jgi:hypothetical protein
MGLLRLFIAWRLLRLCLPLIVCGALLVALVSSVRLAGAGDASSGRRAVDRAVSRVERALEPLVRDARHALTRALLPRPSR